MGLVYDRGRRTIGPEEVSRMLADYLVQSQVMGLVMGLVGRISQAISSENKLRRMESRPEVSFDGSCSIRAQQDLRVLED